MIKELTDVNNKLMCSFVDPSALDLFLVRLQEVYNVYNKKVYVLSNSENSELLCTYSIDGSNALNVLPDTILIHRRKETRTLFTINALNALIRELNGGKYDPNYELNWEFYRDSILLNSGSTSVRHVRTRLEKIAKLS